jgi:hypothetical protein
MVKKIRLVEDEVSDEEMDLGDAQKQFLELAKSMDWKLWELLQTIQRVEKKLSVIDTENEPETAEQEANDEKSKK